MDAATILIECRRLGVELVATRDDRIRFRGAVPAELRDGIKQCKTGLLAILPGSRRPLVALCGRTGRCTIIDPAKPLPEGTAYLCRLGDPHWTPVAAPTQTRIGA